MNEYPAPATIVVPDIECFSRRSDLEQRLARKEMYAWLSRAFGPLWSRCVHEDRGDGVLMLWPQAEVPKVVVVSAVLRLPTTAPSGAAALRMRVAVHAGDVYRDERGFVGGDLNHACRLCDAAPLKAALREADGPVAYLFSDHVHQSIVQYGDPHIDPRTFHPVGVGGENGQVRSWLHVPGEDGVAARAARAGTGRNAGDPPSRAGGTGGTGTTVFNNTAEGNGRVGVQGIVYGDARQGPGAVEAE